MDGAAFCSLVQKCGCGNDEVVNVCLAILEEHYFLHHLGLFFFFNVFLLQVVGVGHLTKRGRRVKFITSIVIWPLVHTRGFKFPRPLLTDNGLCYEVVSWVHLWSERSKCDIHCTNNFIVANISCNIWPTYRFQLPNCKSDIFWISKNRIHIYREYSPKI